jgi:predicted DNA-binding transcriptional regulator AlpA
MSTPLLTRQEIAVRLNVTPAWFYRKRRDLESKGFPKSLPGFTQGRWCPQAVDTWIARHSGAPAPQAGEPQSEEDRQERVRQKLQDRAQRIATGRKRRPAPRQ